MTKGRLEAFTDGVVAVLITILVLEFKAPESASFEALCALWPKFLSYLLSFVFVGIYWANHHHMLHTVARVNGKILWANLLLLLWLSLVPFTTAWMGEHDAAPVPTAIYGVVLLLAAISYTVLQQAIIADQGEGSKLAAAVKGDVKGKISIALYVVAIPMAFVQQWVSIACYVVVALMWLVPDRRIESKLKE
jgi:uncharacterized membrane protein